MTAAEIGLIPFDEYQFTARTEQQRTRAAELGATHILARRDYRLPKKITNFLAENALRAVQVGGTTGKSAVFAVIPVTLKYVEEQTKALVMHYWQGRDDWAVQRGFDELARKSASVHGAAEIIESARQRRADKHAAWVRDYYGQ